MSSCEGNGGGLARFAVMLLCLVVVGAGAGLGLVLIKMKKPPRTRPPKSEGTLVEVITVANSDHPARIEVMGSVIPARELELKAEVGGRVVEQSDRLVPGSVFSKVGELVCRIDSRDYVAALEGKKAQLAQARTGLKVEEGRGLIAKREWEMLKKEVGGGKAQEELALRKPQLAQARAAVKAAESAVAKATLDLERTSIKVPFPAVVRTEFIEIGQLLSPQTPIARLVGAEKFWVQCSVPTDRLAHIAMPGADGTGGASAEVVQEMPEGRKVVRGGSVLRLLPALDPVGRMARLLVEVEDPLGLKTEGTTSVPPLLLGSYVRVYIAGPTFSKVVALPRGALREGSRIWVMNNDDKLEVRKAQVSWLTREKILLGGGLSAGERVVTSSISGAYPGMVLRLPGMKAAEQPSGDGKPEAGGAARDGRK